jgi:hypothetical protein
LGVAWLDTEAISARLGVPEGGVVRRSPARECRYGTVGAGKVVIEDGAGELCFPTARVREPGLRIDLGAKTLGETGIGGSPPDLGTGAELGLVLAPDGWPVEVEGAASLPPD